MHYVNSYLLKFRWFIDHVRFINHAVIFHTFFSNLSLHRIVLRLVRRLQMYTNKECGECICRELTTLTKTMKSGDVTVTCGAILFHQ